MLYFIISLFLTLGLAFCLFYINIGGVFKLYQCIIWIPTSYGGSKVSHYKMIDINSTEIQHLINGSQQYQEMSYSKILYNFYTIILNFLFYLFIL